MLECGEPPLLNNTQLTLVNGTVYSSLVKYNCLDYHVFNNESLLTEVYAMCTGHGNWGPIIYLEGCQGKSVNYKIMYVIIMFKDVNLVTLL